MASHTVSLMAPDGADNLLQVVDALHHVGHMAKLVEIAAGRLDDPWATSLETGAAILTEAIHDITDRVENIRIDERAPVLASAPDAREQEINRLCAGWRKVLDAGPDYIVPIWIRQIAREMLGDAK